MLQTRIIPPTASAHAYPLLLKSLLLSAGNYEPGRQIVYRDRVRFAYPTLIERIHRLAGALRAAGVEAGQTVAVLDWDSHRYLEAMFAVPMLGAVLHTINVRLAPAQILYTMNHADDRTLLVHRDFLPLLAGIRDQLTTVECCILLADDDTVPPTDPSFVGEYEALLAAAPPRYDFEDFDENSVATTFYTTGTTGNPKGVYFSHRQLVLHTLGVVATCAGFEGTVNFRSDDVYMPITPMFHVHAWGMPYVATMLGVKQVYPGKYEPTMLCQLLEREQVTFSHCVPTILHGILTSPAAQSLDLSRWKVLIGGSALPTGLAKAATDRGIRVTTGYGMSETCPILTVSYLKAETRAHATPDEQIAYRTRAGIAAPLVELALWDDDGAPLPHDGVSVGEVVVRAPWLTPGYLGEPERSEALWRGGWLHTGDVASISPDGYLQISDRLKDVIKTGGEWVSSLAIESLVSQHPAVSEVAVIGVPDARWGERPLALVVLKVGHVASDVNLRAHLWPFVEAGQLNEWYVPDRVVFAEAIPKTSVGKIDKKQIRLDVATQQPAS